jgi:repressor LexA
MTDHLTKKQRQILDFITDFLEKNRYSPSYREIGQYFGIKSTATIHSHIAALREKGFLKTEDNKQRSMEVITPDENWSFAIELPLAGLITAGEPIEAVEEKETISIPNNLVGDAANTYVLKVKGDSMIEDGIFNGDYVVVEHNPSPADGDVVVALLDNAYATLKKFYREENGIRLQPANSKMEPIYTKDPLIQGVVKGVVRKFN